MFACVLGHRGRRPKEAVKDDNLLYLNTFALKRFIRSEDCELVYADFENKICVSPFAVLVDHGTKAIIITSRGTLSLEDLTTDLLVDPLTVPGFAPEYKVSCMHDLHTFVS